MVPGTISGVPEIVPGTIYFVCNRPPQCCNRSVIRMEHSGLGPERPVTRSFMSAENNLVHSLSRVAEELVRAANGGAVYWHDVKLTSLFQPVFFARLGKFVGHEAFSKAARHDGGGLCNRLLFDDAA